jgi:predicted SprT family Zn-dependent metalloprotease
MFTLKDVQSIIKGLDAVTGLNGAELVFKQTNSKKVLGSFVHAVRRVNGQIVQRTPLRFEFSKLILNCNRETLVEIVKHEYAHYMALMVYNDNCEHDWRFVEQCKKIGARASEPSFTNKYIEEQSIKMAKYVVECQGCGTVFTYQRKCNTLTACQEGNAKCSCGCTNFKITQNH